MKTCTKSGKITRRKNVPFTMISNNIAEDNSISMSAKGLYLVISDFISKPGFTLYKTVLQQQYCVEGEKAFNRAWKELIDKGYLLVEKSKGKDGRYIYNYELSDEPENISSDDPEGEEPEVKNHAIKTSVQTLKNRTTCSKKPHCHFAPMAVAPVENEELHKTDIHKTDLHNINSFIDDVEGKEEDEFTEITNLDSSLSLDDIFGASEKVKEEYSAEIVDSKRDWLTRFQKAPMGRAGYESESKREGGPAQSEAPSLKDFQQLFKQEYHYKTVSEELISKKLAREDEVYADDPHWKKAKALLLRVFKSFGKNPEAVNKINNIAIDDLSNLAGIAYDIESGTLKIRSSITGYLANTIRNTLGF